VLKADGYKVGVSTFGSAVYLEVWRGDRGKHVATVLHGRGDRPARTPAGDLRQLRQGEDALPPSRTAPGRKRVLSRATASSRSTGSSAATPFQGEAATSPSASTGEGCVVIPAPNAERRSGPGFDFTFNPLEPRAGLLSVCGRASTPPPSSPSKAGVPPSSSPAPKTPGQVAIVRVAVLRKHSRSASTNPHHRQAHPTGPFPRRRRYRAYPDGATSWSATSASTSRRPPLPLTARAGNLPRSPVLGGPPIARTVGRGSATRLVRCPRQPTRLLRTRPPGRRR
jgi:hypothetical protein